MWIGRRTLAWCIRTACVACATQHAAFRYKQPAITFEYLRVSRGTRAEIAGISARGIGENAFREENLFEGRQLAERHCRNERTFLSKHTRH